MTAAEPPICASEAVLRVLRGRWAPQLLAIIAAHEPIHFLALGRAVDGISRKVLSEQLRFFRQAGVVARSRADDRQEVFYTLTNRGRELKTAIDSLNALAERWPSL